MVGFRWMLEALPTPPSTPSTLPGRTHPLIVITQLSFIIIVWKLIMVELRPQVTLEYARRCPATQKRGRGMWLDRLYHGETLSRRRRIENQPTAAFLITLAMMPGRRGHWDGGGHGGAAKGGLGGARVRTGREWQGVGTAKGWVR